MFTQEVEKSIKAIFDFVKIRILQDSKLCPTCFFFRSGEMIEFQEIVFFSPMIQRVIWQLVGVMGQRKLADSVLYVNFIRIEKKMLNNNFKNAILFTFINFVTGESKSLVSDLTTNEDGIQISELKEYEDDKTVFTHNGGIVQQTLIGYQMISVYTKVGKIDESMYEHIKVLDPKFQLTDFLKDFFSGENFSNLFDSPPFKPPEPPTF